MKQTGERGAHAPRSPAYTLSLFHSVIAVLFWHDQADRGTQRPGYGSNLFRFSYCGRQNHRRFWLPRWKPRPSPLNSTIAESSGIGAPSRYFTSMRMFLELAYSTRHRLLSPACRRDNILPTQPADNKMRPHACKPRFPLPSPSRPDHSA